MTPITFEPIYKGLNKWINNNCGFVNPALIVRAKNSRDVSRLTAKGLSNLRFNLFLSGIEEIKR